MIKTPRNRLLDLTCGWYEFVEAEETRKAEPLTDALLPSQELFDLYQAVGAQTYEELEDGSLPSGAKEHLRAFLNEKVLPLLLRQ